ncbi:hypothetical protein ACFFKU_09530 [Kineococcus gynurae]|uniref:Uncharacterized protein n=1 Tax=Kineococcus gynurae TaxID=452979 RepID=A0ABV5LVG0_9ACTN
MTALDAPLLDLDGWADGPAGATRAGSLYALPPSLRARAARELHAAGWWVHVDVILGPGGTHTGVDPAQLKQVRRDLPRARIEVHVIAPHRGDAEVVPELPALLRARPQRVVLPARLCRAGHPAEALVRAAGAACWAEVDRDPPPRPWTVDGFLLMLITPGSTEPLDPARVAGAAGLHGLPLGADGGVGRGHSALLHGAGVTHLVSGRALLREAGDLRRAAPVGGGAGTAAAAATRRPRPATA